MRGDPDDVQENPSRGPHSFPVCPGLGDPEVFRQAVRLLRVVLAPQPSR